MVPYISKDMSDVYQHSLVSCRKFGEMIHQKKAASRYLGIVVSFREGITFFATQICPISSRIDRHVGFFFPSQIWLGEMAGKFRNHAGHDESDAESQSWQCWTEIYGIEAPTCS